MYWKAYKLIYEAKSPVHIGWSTLGYVNRTRSYIPGKNMWAVFTANLTRAIGSPGTSDYHVIGAELGKQVIPSYFYPSLKEPDGTYISYLPVFTDEGLQYTSTPINYRASDSMPEENFQQAFISSYGQTAILPDTDTAEDASLHESEFIVPKVLFYGEQRDVYFVGYVFLREDLTLKGCRAGWDSEKICLKHYVSEIHIGGDRKYGWGHLILHNSQPDPEDFFGFPMKTDGKHPKITINDNSPIPGHFLLNAGCSLKGDIEPLVGREWRDTADKRGAGQHITDAQFCWVPGSVISKESGQPMALKENWVFEVAP